MDLEARLRASEAPDLQANGLPVAGQIASLRERIAQNPGNPGPRNKLALLLQAEGRADEAASVLRDTIACFPRNSKARDQLKALLDRPFQRPAAEPAAVQQTIFLPALELTPAIEALPAKREPTLPEDAPPASGWSVIQEPRDMPIRLSRWQPRGEWIAGGVILLVLGVFWQVWRLLPESHLLQKPAEIVMQGAIPAVSSLVVTSLQSPAPIAIQAEAPAGALPPVAVAENPLATLPDQMPQFVMILQARHSGAGSQAALRMEARLEALHVAVTVPRLMTGAGPPGIGYFYEEDLPEAETLSRRMPEIPGKLRLISGAARAAQQPGAVAIVMP